MFLGSGIRKKSIPDPGSGSATLINCYTHSYTQPEDLKNRKPNKQGYGSEMETVRIRDPRWRHFGSRIRDGDSSDPGSKMETVRIRDRDSAVL
jgi:hypothetical protein